MEPCMEYRGFMLDSARHFIPLEHVIRLMKGASACGMNVMHWHLADDQGWRLQIRKYPRLVQVGSRRGPSWFGAENENENNEGYYMQDEIRMAVEEARKLGMTIVPEVEVPGHAGAMLAAYPEYGCRRTVYTNEGETVQDSPYTYRVETRAGIFPNLLCAGRDETLRFLKDILEEVCELFPGPYVHIGGDEAIKQHWRRCPDCQRRIRENGLKDEKELQKWLVLEIGSFLLGKGKQPIVWNESLDGGTLPDSFIVQHWQGNDADTAAFMAAGGRVISSESSVCYLNRTYPLLDVWDLYHAPRIPDYAKEHPQKLLGIETPLWSERVTSPALTEFLLFPRARAAVLKAEGRTGLDREELLEDLRETCQELRKMGIQAAPESEWLADDAKREAEKKRIQAVRNTPEGRETWRICDDLVRLEEMEKLLLEIGMPRAFAVRVMDCAFRMVPEYCGEAEGFGGDGTEKMAEQLSCAVDERAFGAWKGIPEEIWLDTMKCFSRFVGEHIRSVGYPAFDRGFWTTRQIHARLFRIGELEYELAEADGKREVCIHIPTDVHLEADRLNASVDQARAFLAEYFSAWADAPMTCCSWLLSPDLAAFLPKKSRILRWQKAFDVRRGPDGKEGVLTWVFHLTGAQQKQLTDYHALKEDTHLQRSLKAFLLSGGSIDEGEGPLVRRFE